AFSSGFDEFSLTCPYQKLKKPWKGIYRLLAPVYGHEALQGFMELRDLIINLRLSARSCGSSYLPMHKDLEVMFESTVEPRYNEGPKFRRSRLFFIYFRAKRGALGGLSLIISSSAKRVYRAWC
ncbi:unnamed protein product, partial [Porites evermanni]